MNVRCPSCETVYRVDPEKVPRQGVRARCAACAAVVAVAPVVPEEAKPRVEIEPAPRVAAEVRAVPPPIAAAQRAAPSVEAPARRIAPELPPIAPATAAPPQRGQPPAQELDELVVPDLTPAPPPPAQAPAPMPRYSRPFIRPAREPEAPPARPAAPQRPTAPVFRPTPGAPLRMPAAPAPPPAPARAPAAVPRPVAAPPVEPRRPVNPFLARDPMQKARRLARALVSDMIVYQPRKRQEALAAGTLKQAFAEEIKKSWEEYVQQVGEETAKSTPYFTEALNEILAGGNRVF